ncbi:MAG: hypothetical protein AAF802_24860, partial [Planctomycetota bacterium]
MRCNLLRQISECFAGVSRSYVGQSINIKLFRGAANDEIVLNTKYMIISSSISIVGDLIIIY